MSDLDTNSPVKSNIDFAESHHLVSTKSDVSNKSENKYWLVENIFDPIANVARESVNTLANVVNPILKKTFDLELPKFEIIHSNETPLLSANWWAQNISSGLAMTIPYTAAGLIAKKGLVGIDSGLNSLSKLAHNKEFSSLENIINTLKSPLKLSSENTLVTNVLGAGLYDSMRDFRSTDETSFSNALAGMTSFAIFGGGNHLASHFIPQQGLIGSTARALVRIPVGSIGGIAGLAIAKSTDLSEGISSLDKDTVWQTLVSSGALNFGLPIAQHGLNRAGQFVNLASGRSMKVSDYLDYSKQKNISPALTELAQQHPDYLVRVLGSNNSVDHNTKTITLEPTGKNLFGYGFRIFGSPEKLAHELKHAELVNEPYKAHFASVEALDLSNTGLAIDSAKQLPFKNAINAEIQARLVEREILKSLSDQGLSKKASSTINIEPEKILAETAYTKPSGEPVTYRDLFLSQIVYENGNWLLKPDINYASSGSKSNVANNDIAGLNAKTKPATKSLETKPLETKAPETKPIETKPEDIKFDPPLVFPSKGQVTEEFASQLTTRFHQSAYKDRPWTDDPQLSAKVDQIWSELDPHTRRYVLEYTRSYGDNPPPEELRYVLWRNALRTEEIEDVRDTYSHSHIRTLPFRKTDRFESENQSERFFDRFLSEAKAEDAEALKKGLDMQFFRGDAAGPLFRLIARFPNAPFISNIHLSDVLIKERPKLFKTLLENAKSDPDRVTETIQRFYVGAEYDNLQARIATARKLFEIAEVYASESDYQILRQKFSNELAETYDSKTQMSGTDVREHLAQALSVGLLGKLFVDRSAWADLASLNAQHPQVIRNLAKTTPQYRSSSPNSYEFQTIAEAEAHVMASVIQSWQNSAKTGDTSALKTALQKAVELAPRASAEKDGIVATAELTAALVTELAKLPRNSKTQIRESLQYLSEVIKTQESQFGTDYQTDLAALRTIRFALVAADKLGRLNVQSQTETETRAGNKTKAKASAIDPTSSATETSSNTISSLYSKASTDLFIKPLSKMVNDQTKEYAWRLAIGRTLSELQRSQMDAGSIIQAPNLRRAPISFEDLSLAQRAIERERIVASLDSGRNSAGELIRPSGLLATRFPYAFSDLNFKPQGHDFTVFDHQLRVLDSVQSDPRYATFPEHLQTMLSLTAISHDTPKGKNRNKKADDANHEPDHDWIAVSDAHGIAGTYFDRIWTQRYVDLMHHRAASFEPGNLLSERLSQAEVRLALAARYLHPGMFEAVDAFNRADIKQVHKDASLYKNPGVKEELDTIREILLPEIKRLSRYQMPLLLTEIPAHKPFVEIKGDFVGLGHWTKDRKIFLDNRNIIQSEEGNLSAEIMVRQSKGKGSPRQLRSYDQAPFMILLQAPFEHISQAYHTNLTTGRGSVATDHVRLLDKWASSPKAEEIASKMTAALKKLGYKDEAALEKFRQESAPYTSIDEMIRVFGEDAPLVKAQKALQNIYVHDQDGKPLTKDTERNEAKIWNPIIAGVGVTREGRPVYFEGMSKYGESFMRTYFGGNIPDYVVTKPTKGAVKVEKEDWQRLHELKIPLVVLDP